MPQTPTVSRPLVAQFIFREPNAHALMGDEDDLVCARRHLGVDQLIAFLDLGWQ